MHPEVTTCRTTRTGFTPQESPAPHQPPLIYSKPGCRTFPFFAISPLFCSLSPAAAPQSCAKINRHTGKIEHLVSHRKQRTAPQINRHTSRGPCFPSSLFPFPFSFFSLRAENPRVPNPAGVPSNPIETFFEGGAPCDSAVSSSLP